MQEAIGELCYLKKNMENVKKEKLLQIMCFQTEVLEILHVASRYGPTILTCCHVNMPEKGRCASRGGESGNEGDTGTARNSGNTFLLQLLANERIMLQL
jgi:hypothetical protein